MRRFIPACVGNAPRAPAMPSTPPVHPRVCGERNHQISLAESRGGSSPRVWGTRAGYWIPVDCVRFIPACVGNAVAGVLFLFAGAVHPRVCGERSALAAIESNLSGSSPRVWGTLPLLHLHLHLRRFIPACVGNAMSVSICTMCRTVHPRVCGERIHPDRKAERRHGSSPRVWGTLPLMPIGVDVDWFIPACVGNALSANQPESRRPVHPRVCGERCRFIFLQPSRDGSSPRVWGTLESVLKPFCLFRFIPACVGNAPTNTATSIFLTVHPRVCGERQLVSAGKVDSTVLSLTVHRIFCCLWLRRFRRYGIKVEDSPRYCVK